MGNLVLNPESLEFAKNLIREGNVVRDKEHWSENNPTTEEENAFIAANGLEAYALWHLAYDPDKNPEDKTRYHFPYGNYTNVFRGGLIAAEQRAGQYHYEDIEKAAKELLDMVGPAD